MSMKNGLRMVLNGRIISRHIIHCPIAILRIPPTIWKETIKAKSNSPKIKGKAID